MSLPPEMPITSWPSAFLATSFVSPISLSCAAPNLPVTRENAAFSKSLGPGPLCSSHFNIPSFLIAYKPTVRIAVLTIVAADPPPSLILCLWQLQAGLKTTYE